MTEYPEEYAPEIDFGGGTVEAGDKSIIFTGQDGEKYILTGGGPVGVGDPVVIHTTAEGEQVTHGASRLKVGDKVILVQTQDGDTVGLHAAPVFDCNFIPKWVKAHYEQHDPPDGTLQYASYDIHLSRPLDPYEIVNVYFDFWHGFDDRGVQPWYPNMGVWIGFGPDDENYYWPGGDPYLTVRGQPAVDLGGEATLAGTYDGESRWTINDFMGTLYPYGRADWKVEYIHIHISQQSTLAFYNYTEGDMRGVSLCYVGEKEV